MDGKQWKTKIRKNICSLTDKKKEYEPLIDTLADILQERDRVFGKYLDEGAQPVVKYTNKGGSTNTVKNPMLIIWDELNKTALAYWRELGLTPSAYKKMCGEPPQKKKAGLSEILAKIDV